jgi:hypothetical protein
MRRQLFYTLLLLFTLSLFTSTLYAQDLTETFTFEGVSINYPADWFVTEDDGSIVVLNLDIVLDDVEDEVPADLIAVIVSTPNQMVELALDEEQTGDPLVSLSNFLTILESDSEVELVTVGDYDAARAEVGTGLIPVGESILYVIDVDGTPLIAAVIFGDEYNSEPPIATEILTTITLDPSVVIAEPTEEPQPTDEAVELGDPDVPLEYGDTVRGEITNREDDQVWTFSGSEGDVVTITMLAVADDFSLDTRLYLYTLEGFDSGDDAIAQNDDAVNPEVTGLNSQIELFELPEDGEYVIVATRYNNGTGEYTLTLEEGGLTRAERAAAATPIAAGDELTGEISAENSVQLYTFDGSSGDVVTITMIADDTDDLDPRIALYTLDAYTENGFPTMSNDDAFENDIGLNAQIFAFELFEDATYIIEATYFRGEGGYTLSLESGEGQAGNGGDDDPVVAAEPQPIAYGDEVTGEISDDNDPELWLFSGSEGDIVTITMLADDDAFDTRLYLYHAEDAIVSMNAIAENDDMEDSEDFTYNSQIVEFELPEDGDYIIEATRFGGSEGTYTLTLETDRESAGGDPGRGELSPVGADEGGDDESVVRQWASDADGSSQYGDDAWSFMQATGEPNVDVCADDTRAWASESPTGEDYLELTYDEAVIPTEINIYQSYTPGSIIRVEVANSETGETFEIENSADPGDSPCPGVLTVTIDGAETPVDTVIIYLDQSIGGSWNEIDAVELVGTAE